MYWNRDDLFSRNIWVKDGRRSTLVDKNSFANRTRKKGHQNLSSFESNAAFKWLMKAPSSVISEYVETKNQFCVENIVKANLPKKIPTIILRSLLTHKGQERITLDCVEIQRVYRLWVIHCCDIWQHNGYKHLRTNLRHLKNELNDAIDWLLNDGLINRLPKKNASWFSLTRTIQQWHERLALAKYGNRETYTWPSLIETMLVDGYKITPINDSYKLYLEGSEMHHCVSTYEEYCRQGFYQVFSLLSENNERVTLGLEQTDNGWKVQQIRAVCNGPVSKSAELVSIKIARIYTDKAMSLTEKFKEVA